MLVIDDNSVYEIDEKCMRERKVPKECHTFEKMKKKENPAEQGKENLKEALNKKL